MRILVENFEPNKEAKAEKSNDKKSKETTNNHQENKTDDEILEKGDIVFMCKIILLIISK